MNTFQISLGLQKKESYKWNLIVKRVLMDTVPEMKLAGRRFEKTSIWKESIT